MQNADCRALPTPDPRLFPMILREWHGWTSRENAAAYERLLREVVFPHIVAVPGSMGAYLSRRDAGDEVEFVTHTLFESMDAVRAFAGEDYATAVVPPEAQRLLTRYDAASLHYEVVLRP